MELSFSFKVNIDLKRSTYMCNSFFKCKCIWVLVAYSQEKNFKWQSRSSAWEVTICSAQWNSSQHVLKYFIAGFTSHAWHSCTDDSERSLDLYLSHAAHVELPHNNWIACSECWGCWSALNGPPAALSLTLCHLQSIRKSFAIPIPLDLASCVCFSIVPDP